MKGKNPSDDVKSGPIAGMKGKNPSDDVKSGPSAGMKGINPTDAVSGLIVAWRICIYARKLTERGVMSK